MRLTIFLSKLIKTISLFSILLFKASGNSPPEIPINLETDHIKQSSLMEQDQQLLACKTDLDLSYNQESPQDKNLINNFPDSINPNPITYFFEPYPQDVGNSLFQIGGSIYILPIPLVENEYPIPALDLEYKYGIIKNVSLIGTFSTSIFSNLLQAGFQYNIGKVPFSIGFANHIGASFGYISIEGSFDNNTAFSLFYMPTLRFGYRFNDFSISMAWSISYIFQGERKVSKSIDKELENIFNDINCTFAVEQPFLQSQFISVGCTLSYSKNHYQSWFLFNNIDKYLLISEFFFAYQL